MCWSNDADPTDSRRRYVLPTDKNNLRLNYGSSPNDLRHRFTFSPTYAIPGMKSPAPDARRLVGQRHRGCADGAALEPERHDFDVDWLGTGENNTLDSAAASPVLELQRAASAFSNTGPTPHSLLRRPWGLHSVCTSSYAGRDTSGLPERGAGPLRGQCPTSTACARGTRKFRLLHPKRRRSDSSRLRNRR